MSLSLSMIENEAYSSSKIAIIRDASGLVAIWGIWRNSSRSIEPEPSLRTDQANEQQVPQKGVKYTPIELHKAFL